MNNIKLDRKESERLFYEFKDLEIEVSSLKSIVQNPDFADSNDISIFLEQCESLEKRYTQVKSRVMKLFGCMREVTSNEVVLKLDMNKLQFLEEISTYNHNFYRLPLIVRINNKNCDILLEYCDEDVGLGCFMYSVGYMQDNKFKRELNFGYSEEGELVFKKVVPSDYC